MAPSIFDGAIFFWSDWYTYEFSLGDSHALMEKLRANRCNFGAKICAINLHKTYMLIRT